MSSHTSTAASTHLLDLPSEIRTLIYHHLYSSIIIHNCSIPSSVHEPHYPPQSHVACISKYPGQNLQRFLTVYTQLLLYPPSTLNSSPTTCTSCTNTITYNRHHSSSIPLKFTSIIRVPTSTLIAPHLTCWQIYNEITTQLTHGCLQPSPTLNIDIYSLFTMSRSSPTNYLLPSWIFSSPQCPLFSRVKELDVNVQYSAANLARAMSTAHRDGPMLLDIVWSPFEIGDPRLRNSCHERLAMVFEMSWRVLTKQLGLGWKQGLGGEFGEQAGKEAMLFPNLEKARIILGRRIWHGVGGGTVDWEGLDDGWSLRLQDLLTREDERDSMKGEGKDKVEFEVDFAGRSCWSNGMNMTEFRKEMTHLYGGGIQRSD